MFFNFFSKLNIFSNKDKSQNYTYSPDTSLEFLTNTT